MLCLYREALRIRRSDPAFGDTPLTWRPSADGVLAFDRDAAGGQDTVDAGTNGLGTGGADTKDRAGAETGGLQATVRCVANLSAAPVPLPPHAGILLASGPLEGGLLPPDTTAWLRIS
jgi:alpha-glucosidase